MRPSSKGVLVAVRVLLGVAVAVLLVSGCSLGVSVDEPKQVLRVGVPRMTKPDVQIMSYVKTALAPAIGTNVDVVQFSDATVTKLALRDKRVDAVLVPHGPDEVAAGATGSDAGLTFVAPVHIQPVGIYAAKAKRLADLANGGRILIPSEPVNAGRALQVLAERRVVRLREGAGMSATVRDITANPDHIRIDAVTPAEMAMAYPKAAAVVADASTVREAGLPASRHELALEKGDGSPYADGLMVRAGDVNDPRIGKLVELLRSPRMRSYIETTFKHTLVPAF
jgi:D-methionine transport system substrate-binding protein